MKIKIFSAVMAIMLAAFVAGVWVYVFLNELSTSTIVIVAGVTLILIMIIGFFTYSALKSEKSEEKEEPEETYTPQKIEYVPEKKTSSYVDNSPKTQYMFGTKTEILGDEEDNKTEIMDETRKDYKIKLRDKNKSVKTYETYLSDEIIIGREEGFCNIAIDGDKTISRKHCRIFLSDNGIMIEDLGTPNKTYLNGKQVVNVPSLLENNSEIKMGRSVFSITIE